MDKNDDECRIEQRPDLLHINQQRLSVVLPLDRKLAGVRKFITGQLDGHLKTVGVQVAEIIHTCKTDKQKLLFVKNCCFLP